MVSNRSNSSVTGAVHVPVASSFSSCDPKAIQVANIPVTSAMAPRLQIRAFGRHSAATATGSTLQSTESPSELMTSARLHKTVHRANRFPCNRFHGTAVSHPAWPRINIRLPLGQQHHHRHRGHRGHHDHRSFPRRHPFPTEISCIRFMARRDLFPFKRNRRFL